MHKKVQTQFLAPAYLAEFSCVGPLCSDTCCTTAWQIPLDKRTFSAYTSSKDPQLKPLFDKHVQRQRSARDPLAFGKIVAAENSPDCPMLDNDRLCIIQRRLGESALSHTCHIYPRKISSLNGTLHQVASLSCPEAARLALSKPDAMSFVTLPSSVRHELMEGGHRGRTKIEQEIAQDIHYFCLMLLSESSLSLWQALAVCGVVCQRIEEQPGLLSSRAESAGLIDAIKISLAQTDGILCDLSNIKANRDYQAKFFYFLASLPLTVKKASSNRRWADLLLRMNAVLGEDKQGFLAAYPKVMDDWDDCIKQQNLEYVLRNYLINLALARVFPLGSGMSAMQAFSSLVVAYLSVRSFSAVLSVQGGKASLDDMIYTVQTLERVFEHDPLYMRAMAQGLASCGYASLDSMFPLLI